MKRLVVGLATLAVWAATVVDASAAWNNVYQPTLFGRWRQQTNYYTPPAVVYSSPVAVAAPTVAHSAPDPCNPCQQQQCTTSYTQRCFYQPVTTYQTQSYYEPVTTMQTSYYYEPVTSYRYSCYYDPCTCTTQQVATPVTSYQLRSKCCPVQSWVQRCCQVPVTTYRKSCYLEPKTTCCTTTVGALIPAPCNGTATAFGSAAPAFSNPPSVHGSAAPAFGNPPSVIATPQGAPQGAPQGTGQPPIIDRTAPQGPSNGNMSRSTYPPAQQQWQAPANRAPVANPHPQLNPHPQVKLDRIVFGPESFVEGQIVRTDHSPRPNASVLFVSADNGKRQSVTANNAGHFQVNLASGNWLVYVQNHDGTAQFHSRLAVQEQQTARVTLVN